MAHEQIVYLNGEFLPLAQAKISVLDRGFLFGDGVYEVIPVYGGKPFRLAEHLARLNNSLAGLRIVSPLGDAEWEALFARLIEGEDDQSIYLQITRGAPPKRDHAFPKDPVPPTVFAMCTPIAPIPAQGVSAITVPDIRWQWCHIKAITLLGNVLLRQQAVEQGCAEAILVRDGYAIEGAASNLFAVVDGILMTPPKGHDILPGITRDLVVEIAHDNGIALEERKIAFDELKRASEVWVTSSTREVLPIVELDGVKVGDGIPGPLWARVNDLYQARKALLRRGL
ncbi:D-amino acid aminotransferase [Methylococcus sp. EFPC2]|uniref:D-amino acid aminotransferase n=1 Tax=Methylococcus sp. EFPC2 TaxID=2812648 RepID=UPI0019672623|nr:D-amino acid aminotransferase [Methylococcus sp. EFPC2]QSA97076.1 D-amino acid aminotransferase [Methylococcus sp. EFPC2]